MLQFNIKLNEARSNDEQLLKILFLRANIFNGTNVISKKENKAIIIFIISIIIFQQRNNFQTHLKS